MSTKIYDAYRLVNGDVFALRRQLLDTFPKLLLTERAQRLVSDAVDSYNEQFSLGNTVSFESLLREHLVEEFTKPQAPLAQSNVVVVENQVRGEYYMKVYGELCNRSEQILALPAVAEDFSYWNSSDGPEELTRAQWKDRELAWDEALEGGYDAFSVKGVEINIFSGFSSRMDFARLREFNTRIPTIKQQADALGRSIAMRAAGDIDKADGETSPIQLVWRAYLDWINGTTDKAPYIAQAQVILAARPEPVLP